MSAGPLDGPAFRPTVLVGPSGVGKNTVLRQLADAYPQVWLSVSATTRPARPGETDGLDYFFVSDETFDHLIATDGLLEWATVHRVARYGTPRLAVEQMMAQGRAVIMEVDLQGCRQIRQRLAGVRTVFLAPPSWSELTRRLRHRQTESAEAVTRRLATAEGELAAQAEFDRVIVNRQVASSLAELVNFIGLGSGEPSLPS